MSVPFDWHDDGVLWLINRVVFHPRGFALARIRTPNQPDQWALAGDGREPWTFNEDDDDASFAAVEALLDRARGKPFHDDEAGT